MGSNNQLSLRRGPRGRDRLGEKEPSFLFCTFFYSLNYFKPHVYITYNKETKIFSGKKKSPLF